MHKKDSLYGWLIIALGGLTYVAMGLSYMCMPVLFKEISASLDLSLVQLGVIWGAIGLGSMFMSPFGGLLGDRFGTKRVIFAACMLLGIAGALRAFSSGFTGLFITTLLFGFAHTTIALNMHKGTGVWFSGNNVVIANGILCTTMGVGVMLAALISDTYMSPLLGGWKNVLLLYGAVSVLIGLLWGITRPHPDNGAEHKIEAAPSFRESFGRILGTKEIWFKSLMNMFFFGSVSAFMGFLPTYLKTTGWQPAAADNALALLNGASLIGAIPVALIAGKISKKTVISCIYFLDLICMVLFPFADGFMVWVLVFLFGLIIDGYVAILTTVVMETEGIGPRYAGTAIGTVFTFGNLGIFTISALGNTLANINLRFSFILWAISLAGAFLIVRFGATGLSGRPSLKMNNAGEGSVY